MDWINTKLLYSPVNWLVVGSVMVIWLLLIHSLVSAFTAMKGDTLPTAATAPGQSPAGPPTDNTGSYESAFPTS